MTTAAELARKLEADARRDAIATCSVCDEHGQIAGRQRGHDGVMRAAVWRCEHSDRPLPSGFVPDRWL